MSDSSSKSEVKKVKMSPSEVIEKARNRALQGGIAGAAAMGINVLTLMDAQQSIINIVTALAR